MIRPLLYVYFALLAGALGYTLYALTQPPVHDGAWLLAVFFTVVAGVIGASSFWLASQPKPSTDKE